jgi:tetratricopeptide (TPR) repeat protein
VSGPDPGVKAAALEGRLALGLGAAFAAVALALYAPSFAGPFVSDDVLYLEHNQALRLPLGDALHRILLEPYYVVGNWAPLHQLLLLAEWRSFGASPMPYRVVNALAHALVALALVAVARRAGLGRVASAGAGVLFLVHPAAVEAVAWINQSKTLLAVGLALVSLERWLAHLRAPAPGRLAAATAAGVGALLAKSVAVPLPALLLVAAFSHRGALGPARAAGALVPLSLVAAFVLALNLQAQAVQGGVAPWFGGSPEATARILPWLAWRYLRVTVWPTGLVHGVHPAPIEGWGDPRVLLPAAALAAVAAAAALAVRARRERALGVAWFVLLLAPVLQLVPMINLWADRYLYAALPGATWLVADLGESAARRGARAGRALLAAGTAAALALAALSVAQARRWADPAELYATAAEAFPLGRQGWTGLGATLHQRGDLEGAAQAYLRSLAVFPDDGHVRHLLARVRLAQGRRDLALYDLDASLRLAPGHHDASWTRAAARRLRAEGVSPKEDAPR